MSWHDRRHDRRVQRWIRGWQKETDGTPDELVEQVDLVLGDWQAVLDAIEGFCHFDSNREDRIAANRIKRLVDSRWDWWNDLRHAGTYQSWADEAAEKRREREQ